MKNITAPVSIYSFWTIIRKIRKHLNRPYHPEKVNGIGIAIGIDIGDKKMSFGHEQLDVYKVSLLYVKSKAIAIPACLLMAIL